MPEVQTADTLTDTGPALSATSDAPVAGTEPALSAEVNDVGKQVVDNSKEAADTGETGGDTKPGEAVEPKPDLTPPAVKREITKARNAQRAAEQRALQAETERAQLAEALAKAQPAKAEEARPQRDAFSDPDAYDTALMDWTERRTADRLNGEAQTKAQEAQQAEIATNVKKESEAWVSRLEAYADDHPELDLDAVPELYPISAEMASFIMAAGDDGPAIYHYLLDNRADAERIATLGLAKASVELARLSTKLQAPVRRTKADPMKPLGVRSNAGAKSADDMTTDEYAASIAHRLPFGRKAN